MVTRPSIQELIEGLLANIALLQTPGAEARLAGLVTPALGVLDRLGNEWANWIALLAADNEDIRATLAGVGLPVSSPSGDTRAALFGQTAPEAVAALEAENRALKDRLVAAIQTLNLPAEANAPAEHQAADRAILALLQRSLHRETQVTVAPSRVPPTSGNAASGGLSLDELGSVLHRFLAATIPGARGITLERLQRLAGGASREAWIFDVRWQQDDGEHFEPCILMREPLASVLVSDSGPGCIDGTRRTVTNEIRVLRAMHDAGIPVPDILWSDTDGKWLERPFSIARRLPGTADVAPILATPAADTLLDQYIDILAKIHSLDPAAIGIDFLGTPTARTAALEQVKLFDANFHAQRLEAFPAITYFTRWLEKHQPMANRVSVIHGDYRLGNFLYEGDRIVAILDWEQVHVGDPAEEIAFMYWALWSLDAVCPIEEFVQRYEARSGIAINRDSLAWYRVFIELKMLVVLLTGLKSYFATPERQLHYGGAQTSEMTRDAQLRVIEELARGRPTVAFDAYVKPA